MRRRFGSALFATSLTLALVVGGLSTPAFASDPSCGTAGGVTVCISVSSTTLTGYQLVTASANPAGGPVQFTWAASNNSCTPGFAGPCHLADQFGQNPGTTTDYSFMWPSQKYLDGAGTLEAFVGGLLAVSIPGLTLSNGNVGSILSQNKSPNDWKSYLPPTSWSGSTDPTIAAVGDGAANQDTDNAVADSVAATNPPLFLYLGDVYEDGTFSEMLNHYGWNSMDGACSLSDCASLAHWGQLGTVTQPTIGNHEFDPAPASDGGAEVDYWHQHPLYTSFTFANTLFINLDCGPSGNQCDLAPGSAEYNYVSGVLTAPHPPCVVSYWHIPALSHNRSQNAITAMWALLTDNGGTVVLNGHVHHMEEYLNLNDQLKTATPGQPAMTQLIAGSGGHGVSKVQVSDTRITWPPYPQLNVPGTPGALYLTLNGAANGGTPTSISYKFEDVNHNVLHLGPTLACGASPQITGFSPPSGVAGTQVTVAGSHLTGATALTFNGTAAPTFVVNSDTQITALVPAGATTGPICATISGSPVCSTDSFIVPQPPEVTGFTPSTGPPGTPVTVNGLHFSGASTVTFNGIVASVTASSDTQLTAMAPAGAGTGPICVTVPPNTGCSSTNFTVTPPVGINRNGLVGPPVTNPPGGATQLSLTVGAGGVTAGDRVVVAIGVQNAITITSVTDSKGNSYAPSITYAFSGTGKCTTALYSAQLTTPLVSGDTITVKVSAGSAWGFIAEDWSGLSASDQTGKADSGGASTATVSISTTGSTVIGNEAVFGVACIAGNSTITGDPLYSNVTKLKNVNSPTTRYLALESRVILTTGVQTATYTLGPAQAWSGVIGTFSGGSGSGPQVTGFNPTSGPSGTSVTVTGTGFTGASGVTFNGIGASFVPGSDTQLTATVPGSATTGPICVTVGANTGCSAASFLVTQLPQVTGFNPTLGTPGTSVMVTGTGFTGASGVTFNGTSASFSVTNDITISTSVPSGATDGMLCVTNSAGTGCSASSFDVTAASGLAFVQASSGATGTSSSVAPSWPATTGSGTGVLLVATLSVNTGSTAGTFSAPAGWTLAAESAVASGSHTAVFYIANPASGRSGSETFTYSKTGRSIYGALLEYNGFSAAAVVDKVATSSGTSTSPSTGTTAANTAAAEVLVGAIGNRNTSTSSSQAQGGSATCGAVSERAEASVGSGGTALAGRAIDCVQTATGTAELHSTLSGSQPWTGVIVTFR